MARGGQRAPYALRLTTSLTPHTAHLAQYTSHTFLRLTYTSHLAPRTLRATCHPPPATYPLLTGARCATCTRLRRCCASGGRSNAAALGWWTQSLQSRRRVAELSPSRRPAESCSGSSAGGQARRRGSRIQSDVDPLPASNCGGQLQLRRPTNVVPLHEMGGGIQ